MTYRNVKTGAVIETTAAVSGGDWQEVKPVGPPAPAQEAAQPKPKQPARRRTK